GGDSAGGKVRKIPAAGGASIALCDGNFALGGGAWGDDDTIVFAGTKGLMRVPGNGGTPQALTTVDAARNENGHTRPQFLPGGTMLLFTIVPKNGDAPQFAVLDLQRGGYHAIARGGSNGRYSPSGHLTFVRDGTLFAVPFDLRHLATAGGDVPVIEGISGTGPAGTADYTLSDNGVLVYVEGLSA